MPAEHLVVHPLDARSFRAALARGLGRCVLHLRSGADVTPHREALREAFGRTLAHDPQCEGTRHEYLLDLARAASMLDELRTTALTSLSTCTNLRDAEQHTAVALALAQQGDDGAASVIRASFDAIALDSNLLDSLGWTLVHLDGLAGLVHALRRFGQHHAHDGSTSSGSFLYWTAVDLHGEEATDEAIAAAASHDPLVAALVEAMQARRAEKATKATRNEPPRQTSLAAMIEAARSRAARSAHYRGALGWGRRASADELREATEALRQAHDPWLQETLAQVWWSVSSPAPADVLLPLVESGEPTVAEAAARALRSTRDPDVRALAWRLLETETPRWDALQMLTANRQPGDGARLMARLAAVPDDSDDRHPIVTTLLDIFGGEQASADSIEPLRWLYEGSPCSLCRRDAVSALDSLEAVDHLMRDECRWDSHRDLRDWARTPRDEASEPA